MQILLILKLQKKTYQIWRQNQNNDDLSDILQIPGRNIWSKTPNKFPKSSFNFGLARRFLYKNFLLFDLRRFFIQIMGERFRDVYVLSKITY